MNFIKYLFQVNYEFVKAYFLLKTNNKQITIYGSARVNEDSLYYKAAYKIAKALGENGFDIITGGGPGIMEAANKGAKDANAKSLGCNIVLPKEQKPNKYLDKQTTVSHFFVRKEFLRKAASAFVFFPGGFGTMDELLEIITLTQTKKNKKVPIVVFGKTFYKHLINLFNLMGDEGFIYKQDINLIFFTDSTDEAINHILKSV